ncbi:MAG: hypothetical protein ACFB51_12880, partial [Anaerolineae bacterium]
MLPPPLNPPPLNPPELNPPVEPEELGTLVNVRAVLFNMVTRPVEMLFNPPTRLPVQPPVAPPRQPPVVAVLPAGNGRTGKNQAGMGVVSISAN